MSNRRSFLKNSTLVAAATLFSKPVSSFAFASKNLSTLQLSGKSVIIYYSGQLNGHISSYTQKPGGIDHLKDLLNKQDTGGLLLDSGNFLGTDQDITHHYAVIASMNSAGYHTSMPSLQDLSYGEEYLAKLSDAMNFCLVNCNYVFNNIKLAAVVKPWQIINFGNFKIGITGVGTEIKDIGFHDPIKKANHTAQHLKENMNCDFVVCLSGLDYRQKDNIADNITLAEQSEAIDFIISSNMHRKKMHTMVLKNITGHEVFIGHSLAEGLSIGKMTFEFKEKQKYYAATLHMANNCHTNV